MFAEHSQNPGLGSWNVSTAEAQRQEDEEFKARQGYSKTCLPKASKETKERGWGVEWSVDKGVCCVNLATVAGSLEPR